MDICLAWKRDRLGPRAIRVHGIATRPCAPTRWDIPVHARRIEYRGISEAVISRLGDAGKNQASAIRKENQALQVLDPGTLNRPVGAAAGMGR